MIAVKIRYHLKETIFYVLIDMLIKIAEAAKQFVEVDLLALTQKSQLDEE